MKKTQRTMTQEAKERLTKRFEGCSLKGYADPGSGKEPWTAGYGHTGDDVELGKEYNLEQVDKWLDEDLKEAEAAVNELVTVEISQHMFDALVDFVFNVGKHNLAKSSLLRYLNKGQFEVAADEFDKWVYASGRKLGGLVLRRAAEKQWFLTKETQCPT